MQAGIMQPYFFPYIGYFQLILAVDIFVVFDDVNYKKRHWINRNRILLNGNPHLITKSLKNSSQNKKINRIEIMGNDEKMLKTIFHAYSKAPYFKNVFPLIENILFLKEKNLAKFLYFSLLKILEFLEISTKIIVSSNLNIDKNLRGQDKIIKICKILNANHYINLGGGTKLYSKEVFNRNKMNLSFLHCIPIKYEQFNNEFIPFLSIIDILMFNDIKNIKKMLTHCRII